MSPWAIAALGAKKDASSGTTRRGVTAGFATRWCQHPRFRMDRREAASNAAASTLCRVESG